MIINLKNFYDKNFITTPIQELINSVPEQTSATILIPSELTLFSEPFELKSNVSLCIEPNANLNFLFKKDQNYNKPFISAVNGENIQIYGGGKINGGGTYFINKELPHIIQCMPGRNHCVQFRSCHNVKIQNITIIDSQLYSIHLFKCRDISIHNVNIFNNLKLPNSDGIDPDSSENVLISNCHIETGDDAICVKTNAENQPAKNIVISNSILKSSSCAVKFGSESKSNIENVIISNCIIKESNRGIGLQLRDNGNFNNFLISDCIIHTEKRHNDWWGKAEPIYITSIKRNQNTIPGYITNVNFKNIICESENGVYIESEEVNHISDIFFENLKLLIRKSEKFPDEEYDRRPCIANEIIKTNIAGLTALNSKKISLQNSQIIWHNRQNKKDIEIINSDVKFL